MLVPKAATVEATTYPPTPPQTTMTSHSLPWPPAGWRRCSRSPHLTMEQWTSRRSDYQAQDDEAADVRPSQLRSPSSPHPSRRLIHAKCVRATKPDEDQSSTASSVPALDTCSTPTPAPKRLWLLAPQSRGSSRPGADLAANPKSSRVSSTI